MNRTSIHPDLTHEMINLNIFQQKSALVKVAAFSVQLPDVRVEWLHLLGTVLGLE